MTISPISYSNYQNSFKVRNNLKNKPQIPENQVSFKGLENVATKATTETVKSNGGKILAALAALLGIAGIKSKKNDNSVTENVQVNKPVEKPQSIVDSLDVSPEAKAFGKNLEKVTKKEYIQVGYDDCITRDVGAYNKIAIVKAVELYDSNPKMAFELASLFKDSGKASSANVEFVINKYLAEPELVMEYKNKLVTHARNSMAYGDEYRRGNWEADFDDMLHLTKALDKNKEIVDMVIERLDNNDIFSCRNINSLSNFDKSVVSKYLNDTRVPFDYEDVIKLCELDSKYAQEIDELMDIVSSTMTKEDRRRYPHYRKYKISNIVEKYAESTNECKELFNLTGVNLEALTDLKDAYKEAPEFITRLYRDFYKKEYCTEYVQGDAFKDISNNYKHYETILNLLDEQGWQNMSDEDFAKNMKSIQQTEHKINAVIKETGDISKCATRIANIVKAHQLPLERLYKV